MKKVKCALLSLLIVILMFIVYDLYINMRKISIPKHDAAAMFFITTDSDDILTAPRFDKLAFKADKREQSLLLSNPAGNSADLAIKVVVEGKTVYESGLITPGECIKEITLETPIQSGTYDCVVEYRFYSDGVELNGVKNKCEMEVYK